jgi:hypothetical protein
MSGKEEKHFSNHEKASQSENLQIKLFDRKLHARIATTKKANINSKEIPEPPGDKREVVYRIFTL